MVKQEVVVDYKVQGDEQAKKKTGLLGKAIDGLKKRAKLLAIAGFGALTAIITKSVKLFGVQEKAITKLEAALRSTGKEVSNNSKELQQYASQLQKITTVGDETSLQLLQMSLNMGASVDQAKEATKAAIGLSAAYGIDTQSAIRAATLAQQGNYDLLNRYVPSVRLAKTEEEKRARAMEAFAAAFEVAQAETQTLSGAMAQMQNALGDLGEEIGKAFAPAIGVAARFIKRLAEGFTGLDDRTKKIITILGALGVGILSLIPILMGLATTFATLGVAASAALLGIPVLIAGIIAGFVLLKKNWARISTFLLNSFDSLNIALLGLFKILLNRVKAITDLLNKLPGVDIKVDSAIDNLDRLQDKLRAQQEQRKLDLEAQLQAENEIKATKQQEAAQKEVEINAEKNAAIKAQQDQDQKNRKQAADKYLGIVDNAASQEKDVAKAVADDALQQQKDSLKAQVKAFALKQTAIGFGLLSNPFTFLQGLGYIAAGSAITAAASKIDTIQLAEGGSMVVDQPTRIGNNVVAGEAGPERIDVTPIDQDRAQTINLSVNVGDERVITKVFKLGQRERNEGVLDDGIN